MKIVSKLLSLLIFGFFSLSVFSAWDGTITGKIEQIHVTGGNNYDFRIYLEGKPKMCGNDHNWAYLNQNDSNYNTYVSVLIAAKAAKQEVRIFSRKKDGADDGYCHIGFVYSL